MANRNAFWNDPKFIWDDERIDWLGHYIGPGPSPGEPPRQRIVPTLRPGSWDRWATTPEPTSAAAYIGVAGTFHTFRFNPDQVQWDYQENIVSRDTLGGRVVQLLSIKLNGMTVAGRAGSRKELQRLAKNIKAIMGHHIHTQEPVQFIVPSRNWNFNVYVAAMPQIGWDVASTSYPYQLQLLVDEDVVGIKTRELTQTTLTKLATGVGYDPTVHGGNAQKVYNIVKSVTAVPQTTSDSSGNTGGGLGVGKTITFPQLTTQAQIRKSSWCYESQNNCHHDYNAADIMAPTGTVNVSPVDGKVLSVGDHDSSSTGSRVQILDDSGLTWYMAHMADGSILVKEGQRVSAGDPVGKVGTAAEAMNTVPHLHIDCGDWNGGLRPACSGADCRSLKFINIQPALTDAFKALPP